MYAFERCASYPRPEEASTGFKAAVFRGFRDVRLWGLTGFRGLSFGFRLSNLGFMEFRAQSLYSLGFRALASQNPDPQTQPVS